MVLYKSPIDDKYAYAIAMEYIRHEEYEITFDKDGNHIAGNLMDSYEESEPHYIVEHGDLDEGGSFAPTDTLEIFDTFAEAKAFVEERIKYEETFKDGLPF